jgi:methionyl-tRNA synthetase
MKPWELKKDPANAPRVQTVLYHLAESLAQCAILLSPVLPQAAAKIAAQLRRDDLLSLKLDDLKWGLLEDGHEIGKPKPVFPRIVMEEA